MNRASPETRDGIVVIGRRVVPSPLPRRLIPTSVGDWDRPGCVLRHPFMGGSTPRCRSRGVARVYLSLCMAQVIARFASNSASRLRNAAYIPGGVEIEIASAPQAQ